MINQLVLIGVIKEMPVFNEKGDNYLILEVRRSYKDAEGIYKKDCFKCHLWMGISKKISSSCKEGDLIAVKGRLIDSEGECNILLEHVVLLNKTMSYS